MHRRHRHDSLMLSTIALAVMVGKIISAGAAGNAATSRHGKGEREGGAAIAASVGQSPASINPNAPLAAVKDRTGTGARGPAAANAGDSPVQSAACTAAAHR